MGKKISAKGPEELQPSRVPECVLSGFRYALGDIYRRLGAYAAYNQRKEQDFVW